jgi:hypothetical protein
MTAAKPADNPRKESKEKIMPHVIVKLWPGKSEQQKARLAEARVFLMLTCRRSARLV